LAATIDKHRRLAEVKPPRILLVGGSGTAFGWHSPVLEQALGRPVVNLGLHSDFGLEVLLREAESVAVPGDWVVLSPEYMLFGVRGNQVRFRQVFEHRPRSFFCIPPDRWVRTADQHGLTMIGGYLRRALRWGPSETVAEDRDVGSTYRRAAFNTHGDYVAHYGAAPLLWMLPPDNPRRAPAKILPFVEPVRRCLADTVGRWQKRGIVALLTCPPHPSEALEPNRQAILANHEVLRTIPGLVVLDSPDDATFAITDFYDTNYHLTGQAGEGRTSRLARQLKDWLAAGVER
jgi:hypothetical protein